MKKPKPIKPGCVGHDCDDCRRNRNAMQREARAMRTALTRLSDSVLMYLHAIDTTVGPNKEIPRAVSEWLGKASGSLELQNDLARQALGVSFSADGKAKALKRLMRSNDRGNRRMTAALSPAGVRVDRRVMRLAALFVQPDGCYAGLPDVDAWPEARDARRYTGPLPVVAHPPCQLWGAMANVNYARWGGDHNKPGNDGGCFAAALESVRRFGGVLEHPAKTKAWAAHGLAQPAWIGWQRTIDGGWVCEVWQSAYGHRANKATWLYYHGTNPPFELRWERPAGTHQIGFHDQRGKAANKPTLGKREANATPLEFRDELLRLAMKAHNVKSTAPALHNLPD